MTDRKPSAAALETARRWFSWPESRDRLALAFDDFAADLVAALRPFAEAAADLDDKTKDSSTIWELPAALSITAGDLRRAASALAKSGAPTGKDAVAQDSQGR